MPRRPKRPEAAYMDVWVHMAGSGCRINDVFGQTCLIGPIGRFVRRITPRRNKRRTSRRMGLLEPAGAVGWPNRPGRASGCPLNGLFGDDPATQTRGSARPLCGFRGTSQHPCPAMSATGKGHAPRAVDRAVAVGIAALAVSYPGRTPAKVPDARDLPRKPVTPFGEHPDRQWPCPPPSASVYNKQLSWPSQGISQPLKIRTCTRILKFLTFARGCDRRWVGQTGVCP